MANLAHILGNFGNADPNSGSGGKGWLDPGCDLEVEIGEIEIKDSETTNRVNLIVEFRVISGIGVEPGQERSWVHDLQNRHFGVSRALQFVISVLGHDPKGEEWKKLGLDGSALEEASSQAQPLKGRKVKVTTAAVQTKALNPDGTHKMFTVYTWAPA